MKYPDCMKKNITSRPRSKPPCYCASCMDWINAGDKFKRDSEDRPVCIECTQTIEERSGK